MNFISSRFPGGGRAAAGMLTLAILLLLVLPLSLDIFRLNLVGKYLTYGFVGLGLVLLWGRAGVLSLGQGIFFGLGGYCMAMFLKLEASDPKSTAIQSTPGIPDFMDWNQITELPAMWMPFKSLPVSLVCVFLVPALVAFIVGAAMFKRRVGGVYFAVITQALALILSLGIDGNQGLTGGRNGITDLRTLLGWDIRTENAQYALYFVTCILLFAAVLLGYWLQSGKIGRILLALRDREERVMFSGYDVAACKTFAFCLAAALSGLGGALFVLQVGFISPSLVGIVPSIEMVIFTAVGGKMSPVGAIYGALIVNTGKSLFSENFPQLWLFLMGGLFIAVVVFFPNGLAGVFDTVKNRLRFRGKGDARPPAPSTPSPVATPTADPAQPPGNTAATAIPATSERPA
jgi:urea transport system permease protein